MAWQCVTRPRARVRGRRYDRASRVERVKKNMRRRFTSVAVSVVDRAMRGTSAAAAAGMCVTPLLPKRYRSTNATTLTTDATRRKVYIETYGCQMNSNDTEIVRALLVDGGYDLTERLEDAHAALVNTCAVREGAEQRVWTRLRQLKALKRDGTKALETVGVLGCMAERLKSKLLETDGLADVVCGPDAYRDVPRLLDNAASRVDALEERDRMNVLLSLDETYADVKPARRDPGSPSAYVSVMRGCDNMCAFCVVPFTRGRERSRPFDSVVRECEGLVAEGVKEITLLGQNVNSYADGEKPGLNEGDPFGAYARGFKSVYKPKREGARRFADLVAAVAAISPEVRVRFTSPHPKDFPDELLRVIAETPNVCKQLHMPAQSGSSTCLERMRRGYTREAYIDLISRARAMIPGVALSSDFISGFCGETEEEHEDTLSLLREARYEQAFMFHYSLRDKTHAARNLTDDVPEDVKKRRLAEVIETFRAGALEANAAEVGRTHLVLVEGASKKNPDAQMSGRSDSGKRVVIQGRRTKSDAFSDGETTVEIQPGDYVVARVDEAGASTLVATPLGVTSAKNFYERHGGAVASDS